MTRKRWIAAALMSVWVVALVVAGVWSYRTDAPTVREQSELAQGRQALDRAVEAVASAAGSGVTVEVGDYQVTTGCRVTLARQGTAVEREVVLTVPEGGEAALLDRLAERLPQRWPSRHYRAGQRLSADAGEFVTVVGEVAAPGRVDVTAATGCRPGDDADLPTP